jgi:hypothetical protein
MITLRMARVLPAQAQPNPAAPLQGETDLAFSYLTIFRRVVVGLALIGALLAFVEHWPGLRAVVVCVGIGELLESTYYLSVSRWRQHSHRCHLPSHHRTSLAPYPASAGAGGSRQATTSITSDVASTPKKTA